MRPSITATGLVAAADADREAARDAHERGSDAPDLVARTDAVDRAAAQRLLHPALTQC